MLWQRPDSDIKMIDTGSNAIWLDLHCHCPAYFVLNEDILCDQDDFLTNFSKKKQDK